MLLIRSLNSSHHSRYGELMIIYRNGDAFVHDSNRVLSNVDL